MPYYGSYQSQLHEHAASWSDCMAWGTGALRVAAGNPIVGATPHSCGPRFPRSDLCVLAPL
jgi:hypothetical protein